MILVINNQEKQEEVNRANEKIISLGCRYHLERIINSSR